MLKNDRQQITMKQGKCRSLKYAAAFLIYVYLFPFMEQADHQ